MGAWIRDFHFQLNIQETAASFREKLPLSNASSFLKLPFPGKKLTDWGFKIIVVRSIPFLLQM